MNDFVQRFTREISRGTTSVIEPGIVAWDAPPTEHVAAVFRVVESRVLIASALRSTASIDQIANFLRSVPLNFAEHVSVESGRGCIDVSLGNFDQCRVLAPRLARVSYDKSTQWTRDVCWLAVPGFKCECSSAETPAEAETHERNVRDVDWKRSPEPFMRMRFEREKRKIRSTGGKRKALFKWEEIRKVLAHLATDDGFMEIQNFEGEDARIDHHDGYTLSLRGVDKGVGADDAKAWLSTFAIRGADEALKALGA